MAPLDSRATPQGHAGGSRAAAGALGRPESAKGARPGWEGDGTREASATSLPSCLAEGALCSVESRVRGTGGLGGLDGAIPRAVGP